MTLSNVEAVFDNSRTFYVRVAGEREVDLFNITAGTALRVTPHVTREAAQTRIRMLVNIEDGSVTGDTVEAIPVVERATINTQALIAEGQSLLVGGLTVDAQSNDTDQIPILGDIPLIGNLFKTNRRSEGRIERLFLITPRVANLIPQAPGMGPRLDAPVTPPPPPLPTPPSAPTKAPAAVGTPTPPSLPVTKAALQPAAAKPMIVKAAYTLPPSGLEPTLASVSAVVRPAPITMAPIPNPVVKRAAFKRTAAKRRALRNRYRAWTPRS